MSNDYPQWGPDYAPTPQPPKKKMSLSKKVAIGVAGTVTFFAVLGACTSGSDNGSAKPSSTPTQATPTPSPTPTPTVKPSKTPEAAPTREAAKPKKTEKSEADYTVSQENAIQSAQSYLDLQGFSRDGLIDQLSSQYGEGFSKADAVFAVDHVDADWNAEAVQAAKSYLELQGFSRSGLIDQLSSAYGDQFTVAQATYAVDHVGL